MAKYAARENIPLILKISVAVLFCCSIILYVVSTAGRYWQKTEYKNVYGRKAATVYQYGRNFDRKAYLQNLFDDRCISTYSGLWIGCYTTVWPHRPYKRKNCGYIKHETGKKLCF